MFELFEKWEHPALNEVPCYILHLVTNLSEAVLLVDVAQQYCMWPKWNKSYSTCKLRKRTITLKMVKMRIHGWQITSCVTTVIVQEKNTPRLNPVLRLCSHTMNTAFIGMPLLKRDSLGTHHRSAAFFLNSKEKFPQLRVTERLRVTPMLESAREWSLLLEGTFPPTKARTPRHNNRADSLTSPRPACLTPGLWLHLSQSRCMSALMNIKEHISGRGGALGSHR